MAKCAICGKRVLVANVMHGSCWARRVEEAAQRVCIENCRWPWECGSQAELDEHCDSCALLQLGHLRSGGKMRYENQRQGREKPPRRAEGVPKGERGSPLGSRRAPARYRTAAAVRAIGGDKPC